MLEDVLHVPVMLQEVLDFLKLRAGQTIVDATLGTGGHALEILKRITPKGRLIGIDRDENSLNLCRQRLSEFKDNTEFVHANFVDLDQVLNNLGIENIDGIVFDLGISSYQLRDAQRGFSFQEEGPLDMRLDKSSYICAYDLVNNLNENEISQMLWNFGQERWHNRIAHLLVQERRNEPISTTKQLANLVMRAIPHRYRRSYYRIHPATRTFQAVRIAVNRELEILESAIKKAVDILRKQARICVISFHSLEDRAIKHTFRALKADGLIDIITAKPLTPGSGEIEANPSSRSSKFRVAERI
ncbi:MAG: 16S rRNA (cytosine(1402)-N(4))-methyltransferase RsmH [Candidatus Omnitrophica bacterium]|nr:16S rRNA (cytosine(1402)-N(4))-methyltransferase RsmH [Candidatus Omnitrophota bacterium]MBU4302893.1 16S rRNA (cytosine(1402)-N(4))-methyltransferase RsmH [Candidatus Omnitrophota bacterium]MBU4468352.1 16S rRNA (cytosine(1402)-N(4))-methyltransferase RsmH [Candidatus Omnitrophota bacterium]MCG2707603.1 16S rRNA (cytosine(1402)-N(4))-methyltransferase RsmH [Candidatus Omnitrophota bacterium]